MPHCLMVDCGFNSNRKTRNHLQYEEEKGWSVRFFKVPGIISHQGEQTEEVSTERRRKWLSEINKADLKFGRVGQIQH